MATYTSHGHLYQVHMVLPEGARTLFAAAFHDYKRAFKYAGEA